MLDWDKLGQEKFDRVTATLIRLRHPSSSTTNTTIVVPDGRGGDRGIDVLAVVDDTTWVYQQKYFPDGFSGNSKSSRQRQIRESFAQAMQGSPRPDVWVLVVPRDLTHGERDFVMGLADRVKDGSRPTIEVMGQAELDHLIAQHPHVEGYALRDEARHLLDRVAGTLPANAVLSGLEDYTARMGDLDAAADDLDADWSPRVTTDSAGEQSIIAVPKHSNPHPIEHVMRVSVQDMDHDTRQKWEHVIGYGLPGEIEIRTKPGDSFYRRAPQFLKDTHDTSLAHAYLLKKERSAPHPLVDQMVELRLELPNHTRVSELLKVVSISEGYLGGLIRLQASSSCTIDLFTPPRTQAEKEPQQLRLQLHIDLVNKLPQEALEAIELRSAFVSCRTVTLDFPALVHGRPAEPLVWNNPLEDSKDSDDTSQYEDYRLLLEDLVVIQRHTRQKFIQPDHISEYERTVVRFLRLLLEGHVVAVPRMRSLGLTLDPDRLGADEPHLRGEAFVCLAQQEHYALQLWGRELTVPGPVNTYHPAVHLEPLNDDGDRVTDDHKARVAPANSGCFVAYRPDKVAGPSPLPTSWGLRGIEEPLTYDADGTP